MCLLGEIFQGSTGPDPTATELQEPSGGQDLADGSMIDVQLFVTLCTLTLNCVCEMDVMVHELPGWMPFCVLSVPHRKWSSLSFCSVVMMMPC